MERRRARGTGGFENCPVRPIRSLSGLQRKALQTSMWCYSDRSTQSEWARTAAKRTTPTAPADLPSISDGYRHRRRRHGWRSGSRRRRTPLFDPLVWWARSHTSRLKSATTRPAATSRAASQPLAAERSAVAPTLTATRSPVVAVAFFSARFSAHHPHHREHRERARQGAGGNDERCHRATYPTGAQVVPPSLER